LPESWGMRLGTLTIIRWRLPIPARVEHRHRQLSAAYAKDFGKIVDGYADGLPQTGEGAREKAEAYTRKNSPLGYYLQAGRAGPREAFAECFAQLHGLARRIRTYFRRSRPLVKKLPLMRTAERSWKAKPQSRRGRV
jgi:hypothetical protein